MSKWTTVTVAAHSADPEDPTHLFVTHTQQLSKTLTCADGKRGFEGPLCVLMGFDPGMETGGPFCMKLGRGGIPGIGGILHKELINNHITESLHSHSQIPIPI